MPLRRPAPTPRALATLHLFVGGVALLGLALLTLVLQDAARHALSPWALLLALVTVAAGRVSIKVPGHSAQVSISEPFSFIAVMLYGPSLLAAALAIDGLVTALRLTRRLPRRVLFNFAEPVVSIVLSTLIAHAVLQGGWPDLGAALQPVSASVGMAVLVTAYFLINTGLTALAIALESGTPVWTVWRQPAPYLALNYYAGASVALLAVDPATGTVRYEVAGLLAPLLALSFAAYRSATVRLEQSEQHVRELDERYLATIEALAIAVDVKDDVTHGHVRRVQRYSLAVAEAMGVTDRIALRALDAAALLHDVGKITVPDRVLQKPTRLTPAEFETMKEHAASGARILEQVRFPYPVVPIVRHHHEAWNGTGYPDGIAGDAIPLGARILSVVDCFDAVTSDRPYRRRMTDEAAITLLTRGRGTQFDPRVVDTFLPLIPELRAIDDEESRLLESSARHRPEPARASAEAGVAGESSVAARMIANGPMLVAAARAIVADCEVCCYAVDRSGDRVDPVFASGSLQTPGVATALRMGAGVSGWVAANRQLIAQADARLDLADGADRVGLPSAVSLPIFSGGSLVGVFAVYYRPSLTRVSDDDVAALGDIAQLATQRATASDWQSQEAPIRERA